MAQTIAAYIKGLDQLSSAVRFAELKQQVAVGGLLLIEKGFQTETDPYGKKWKFVKSHSDHQGILWDSGFLKSSWRGAPSGNGVTFSNAAVYAAKQNATRPMIPDAARGLPAEWTAMIKRSFSKVVRDALKETL